MKRVFIVHCWSGTPDSNWYPWLKAKLEKDGFDVEVPQLPNTDNPQINNWIPALSEVVGLVDNQTYFVGHSMGCQTIARFLETLPDDTKIGGAVFVAGFFKHLSNMYAEPEDKAIADSWLNAPLDFNKVKKVLSKSVAIFSEDDPDVPLDNKEEFEHKLGSEIIVVNGMKHFTDDAGVKELPIALEKFLEIAK